MTNWSHKNKGNDHQLKKLLIFKQILLIYILWIYRERCGENQKKTLRSTENNFHISKLLEQDVPKISFGALLGDSTIYQDYLEEQIFFPSEEYC